MNYSYHFLSRSELKPLSNFLGPPHSATERWILEVILSKQFNPVSVNSNVFTLLNLPDDLQSVIRTEGLEGSKVLELKKVSGKNLNLDEAEAIALRAKLIQEVVQQGLSLDRIRARVKEILQTQLPNSEQPKPIDISHRLLSIPKQLNRAKVWEDTKKRQKLEKLLNELEGLLL